MSRSRELPPPPSLLRSPVAKIALAIFILVPIAFGVRWLERQNRHHQADRMLAEHPDLNKEVTRLKALIAATEDRKASAEEAARGRFAVALWFGEILEYKETPPPSPGLDPTITLKLADPILLAGSRGKSDRGADVQVSLKTRVWSPGTEPVKGERWVVAVWRDTSGNNILHSATPAGK